MGDQHITFHGLGGTKYKLLADELSQLFSEKQLANLELKGGVSGIASALNVNPEAGLAADEGDLQRRRDCYGPNKLPEPPQTSILTLIWGALQDRTLIVLIIAAVVSTVLECTFQDPKTGWIDGTAIIFAVVVVVSVTAINDYQKEKQFRALNAVRKDHPTKVLRDETHSLISVFDIVVGDVVCLEPGDVIPADGLFISGHDLRIDESSMTGESDPIAKSAHDPFLLSGTTVVEGDGEYLVCAVGIHSQVGKIHGLLDSESDPTPLQEKLEKVAGNIGKLGLYAAVLTFVALFVRFWMEFWISHKKWENAMIPEMLSFFITAIVVLVVAVPEGLPLAVTISLAYSVRKMLIDNNLVRHLDSCETMGGATSICSDKTGTLTTNRMAVAKCMIGGPNSVFAGPPPAGVLSPRTVEAVSVGIAANSTACVEMGRGGVPIYIGNKTECALLSYGQLVGGSSYKEIRKQLPVIKRFPFSSARKMMGSVVSSKTKGGQPLISLHVKGAAEIVLGMCSHCTEKDGTVVPLTEERRAHIQELIKAMARESLRCICLAWKEYESGTAPDFAHEAAEIPSGLAVLGVFGIKDPLRPEVPGAVQMCKQAGITVRMVTGDNIATARAIAAECGILDTSATSEDLAMEGPEFRRLVQGTIEDGNGQYRVVNIEEFKKIAPHLKVLARSSPDDKHTLVCGLRELGEVVAVTGDGTNDGPALRRADVGFSMGITGTEVAKEASDIILIDDNFSSIVKAVMWGRNVYDSIRKFLQFQLTINLVAISLAFIGACITKMSPLSAVQMLWVNLIMDTFASLALATEPPTEELLQRKPYQRDQSLISRFMMRFIAGHFVWQLFVFLVILFYGDVIFGVESGQGQEMSQHYTILFNCFVWMQLFNQINARKLRGEQNVFAGITRNKIFVMVMVIEVLGQLLIVCSGGQAFKTVPISFKHWLCCIAIGSSSLVVYQFLRFIPLNLFPKHGYEETTEPASVRELVNFAQASIAFNLRRISTRSMIPGQLSKHASRSAVDDHGLDGKEKAKDDDNLQTMEEGVGQDMDGGVLGGGSRLLGANNASLRIAKKASYQRIPH
eukprot:tig00022075_g23591.t2